MDGFSGRYESSVMCRGHAQATSTFVSPLNPGFYTLRLVRDETETLAMATFRVHKPLSENGKQHWSGELNTISKEAS